MLKTFVMIAVMYYPASDYKIGTITYGSMTSGGDSYEVCLQNLHEYQAQDFGPNQNLLDAFCMDSELAKQVITVNE